MKQSAECGSLGSNVENMNGEGDQWRLTCVCIRVCSCMLACVHVCVRLSSIAYREFGRLEKDLLLA